MATSLTKMFVNYKGTKSEFEKVKSNYSNLIVFINEGSCIYARGAYYGSVDEALASLKYFSSIKVGEKVATAAGPEGTITFSATDPQSISVDVTNKGITIGLTDDFVAKVNNAAVKADVDAEIKDINDAIEALEAIKAEARIAALEEAIGLVEGEEPDGNVVAQIANLLNRIAAEEEARAAADITLQSNIDAKVAQSDYDEAIGALQQADADNLQAAKDYADSLVYNDSELAGRVSGVEDAIEVLNSSESVEGSVAAQVKGAINAFANELSDDSTVNTFKELVEYAASHSSEYSELAGVVQGHTTSINTLKGDENTVGSVAKAVADAVAVEKGRAELAESGLQQSITALEGAYQAADTLIDNRLKVVEVDYLKAADKAGLEASIATKVAQSAYDTKIAALEKADTDNLEAAKAYANSLAGNYEAAGAAAAALASANEYTDALANGAVATNAANIKTNQDDIDAIEAYINNPWEEVNA